MPGGGHGCSSAALTRARVVVVGIALVGGWPTAACGASRPTPAPHVEGVVRRAAGPDLARVPRSTPGRLRLAVWIDAGSRDADPPQVATVAARLAATAGGPDVRAQVVPDGTELAVGCSPEALPRCIDALARALAFRNAAAAAVQRERTRLADDRRRALAADPMRQAEALALGALLGPQHGAAMQPLGVAERDDDVSAAAVTAFAARHYGPRRALLVAAGELPDEELERELARAFASAPPASAPRAPRELAPESGVAVEVGDQARLALALTAADVARAGALGTGLADALEQARAATDVTAHVFAVRGGALAILRASAVEPKLALEVAARAHQRLARPASHAPTDVPAGAAPTSSADSLSDEVQRVGMRWCAGGGGAAPEEALSAGVLVPGGRADRVVDDPDLARRKRATVELTAAFARGRSDTRESLEGELDAAHAEVRLDSGVRVQATADPHARRAAIALRFAPGAAADTPLLHGRAALLATLATTACAAHPRRALRHRLRALGATLAPSVVEDGWGVVLSAPLEHWEQSFALAIECALSPSFRSGDVVAARHALRARLAELPVDARLWAVAADTLAPDSPGALAPWGDPAMLGGISRHALRQLHRQSARGERLRVGLVGRDGVDAMVIRVAARLSRLPPGGTPGDTGASPAAAVPPPTPPDPGEPVTALVGWRAEGGDGADAGALAFATAARAQLATDPDLTPLWHGGGGGGGGGWAAVTLRLPAARLPDLPALAARLASRLDGPALGSLARELWAQRRDARVERLAAPAVRALSMVETRGPGSAEAAAAAARGLARATPRVAPLR